MSQGGRRTSNQAHPLAPQARGMLCQLLLAALVRLVRTQSAATCCKAYLDPAPAHTMPAGRWITPVPDGARGRKTAVCGDSAAGCIATCPRDQGC